jgi:acyl-CoA dehydrogenase
MDFRLSSEQDMLRDGVRRFVTDNLGFDARAANARSDQWAAMAEMGWLMLPVPEDCDGLGGGIEDIAIVAEELGRGLALTPYVEAAALPARLIDLAASDDQRKAILPDLALGTTRIAVALYEPRGRFSLVPQTVLVDQGMRLSGTKVGVEGGAAAGQLIVSAQLGDETELFLIDSNQPGISRSDYDAIDGRCLSDFSFADVEVSAQERLAGGTDVVSAIEQAVDEAIVAHCAEAVGCMDRAIEQTAEYLKIRQQFGQSLASFQALQHGVANLFIEANDARSILFRAMSKITATPDERRRAVSGCKVKVMEAARATIGQAVHYHGGIGVTTEYSVGHYLRRVLFLAQRFGNSAHHFERIMTERYADPAIALV